MTALSPLLIRAIRLPPIFHAATPMTDGQEITEITATPREMLIYYSPVHAESRRRRGV